VLALLILTLKLVLLDSLLTKAVDPGVSWET